MNSEVTIKSADDFAQQYDDYIQQRNWYGAEIMFGLMFEYLNPKQNLLDIGIGTGLSSLIFKSFGLKIIGIDGSPEMIKHVQKKGIANNLKIIDLTKSDNWFDYELFDNAISHGVFHLIGDLNEIFTQTTKCLKSRGIFAFTIQEHYPNIQNNYLETQFNGIFAKQNQQSGIFVYNHSNSYIIELLDKTGFKLLKKTEFLAFVDDQQIKTYFSIYITQKN